MQTTHLKGNPVQVSGAMPETGSQAPGFKLTGTGLSDHDLSAFSGKKLVLNVFPSLDTAVCAASVRKFNEIAAAQSDAMVLCISRDLPFAHQRFCTTEGIENVTSLSELRDMKFGEDYGLRIIDGPLAGLLARAVLVLDKEGKVIHKELVNEITQEPDYEAALAALK